MGSLNVFLVLVFFQVITTTSFAMANDTSKSDATVKYTWELNDADKTHLFNGIKLLRYGDSISDVKKRLGNPIKEFDSYTKDNPGKFIEHDLIYAIKRVQPEGGNEYDHEINLHFDKQGRLLVTVYKSMSPINGKVISIEVEPQTKTKYFITRPPERGSQER